MDGSSLRYSLAFTGVQGHIREMSPSSTSRIGPSFATKSPSLERGALRVNGGPHDVAAPYLRRAEKAALSPT
jgi:hypothetical protein